ncbi:MAG: DUF1697 domain-containing protein [Acidobacteriota bacterium]|nr:DUF1697 domain-containing protein [Acidobacteriota bacterium]MDE3168641.1 DUF1697 domain-containing protein [Acidobacteriota bacterium]
MALVVFLRGVNVGGHRTFRPSVLAKQLRAFDVVSIGAAGTFVVRKPGSPPKFRAALRRKLQFETEIVFCDGRDLIALESGNPFRAAPLSPGIVRFVSVLSSARLIRRSVRAALPSEDDWLLRIVAAKGQFVFGMYRRHVKTIGYLGQIDRIVGAPVTTRNWNTIAAIIRVLKAGEEPSPKKMVPAAARIKIARAQTLG